MTPSKDQVRATYRDLVSGLRQNFAKDKPIILLGETFTLDELVTVFETMVALSRDSELAFSAYRSAVAKERRHLRRAHALRLALKRMLISQIGPQPAKLGSYGIPMPKPMRKSIKTRAQAVEKAKATRAARHTMGKEQRKRVKAPQS